MLFTDHMLKSKYGYGYAEIIDIKHCLQSFVLNIKPFTSFIKSYLCTVFSTLDFTKTTANLFSPPPLSSEILAPKAFFTFCFSFYSIFFQATHNLSTRA